MASEATTTVRLLEKGDGKIIVGLGTTNYQIHLKTDCGCSGSSGECGKGGGMTVGHRARGVIRLPIYKVDKLETTGHFIEPVYGRPRRVHGHVAKTLPCGNVVIKTAGGALMLADLTGAVKVAELAVGDAVGLDVLPGSSFEAAAVAAAV